MLYVVHVVINNHSRNLKHSILDFYYNAIKKLIIHFMFSSIFHKDGNHLGDNKKPTCSFIQPVHNTRAYRVVTYIGTYLFGRVLISRKTIKLSIRRTLSLWKYVTVWECSCWKTTVMKNTVYKCAISIAGCRMNNLESSIRKEAKGRNN